MKLYAVHRHGTSTLCGYVALFDDKQRAKDYATEKNKQSAFSPTATKDAYGISKAYLMGDGRYSVREITIDTFNDLEDIFEWE